ncbi:DUF4390 domain-containing protein [Hydromonas duriensis]|uniref:Uncharacterized protein DUF4390 n=1 Tax=Hydromonas duriensis TaxID=1527608 RepID=A0A4R6Y7H7_9BURK|nr:DUF4390 domain-containing protein [Hydromonas duriensis]TDR31295.1 uncharacterized protein DUF4390 [Hydromonas duriensis]
MQTLQNSTLTRRWQRVCLVWIWVCASLLMSVPAHAAISTQYATLTRQSDGGYAVNADFRFSMPQQLQEAINHGTPITFTVEFELARPRWYWTNEDVVSARRDYRISYNSLTQQYRVAVGADQYRFSTLSECVLFASRPSQWRVLSSNQMNTGEQYNASIRMSLNTARLPRTYQLNSLTQQGWGLDSGWYRFNFTPR